MLRGWFPNAVSCHESMPHAPSQVLSGLVTWTPDSTVTDWNPEFLPCFCFGFQISRQHAGCEWAHAKECVAKFVAGFSCALIATEAETSV